MASIKQFAKQLTNNKVFELSITAIIIINSVLIGVETYTDDATIKIIQKCILGIFTFEILARFIAADNIKSFFTNTWNIFDLVLVIIGYIPETLFANGSAMMALRVLRVFRVLRLLRAAKEIKVIITVLVKSMSSMFYNVVLFFIFVYLYAIIGVGLFKLPNPEKMEAAEKERFEQFMAEAPNAPTNSVDPFGTLGEAMFTLFRELTGDDWTDIRYNHTTAYERGFIKANPTIINIYHISWFVLSAFLLLNLVTGAILNNYQNVMDAKEKKEEEKEEEKEE